jgi:toxin ParE1/3/4
MARVVWTNSGAAHLKEIVDFWAQRSPAKAESVSAQLVAAGERLELLPLLGRVVPEYKIETLRELIVSPYRLIYSIREDVCRIVAVIDSRRDFPSVFRPPELNDDDSDPA